ncbi:MAG: peptidylprolyl isomerase [candidate division KSB1 bacterium]|nr:peptidylprolyl isomerase [candidate division KSB1 bacterium]
MRRVFRGTLFLLATLLSCSRPSGDKLAPNSAAYVLANDLARILPFLDPDENRTLIRTRYFRVTTGDAIQYLVNKMGESAASFRTMPPERVKATVLRTAETLAEQKLLMRAAREAGISVSPAQVDSVMEAQAQRFGGPEQYHLLLQRSGVNLDFLRAEAESSLLIARYLERELAPLIEPTEEDIRMAYEEERYATFRHILFLTEGHVEEDKQAIRAKAEGVLARARAGEPLAELARLYSDDANSKENGGLMEHVPRGELVEPLDSAAFSLPPGQVSDLIATPYGYHILEVVERHKDPRPLEEIRPWLVSECRAKKRVPVYQQFLERLRKDARWRVARV